MFTAGLIALSFTLGRAEPTRAGTGNIDLTCWSTATLSNTSFTWATPLSAEQTDSATGDAGEVQSLMILFPDSATTDYDIQCSFIVPADYDTSGSAPQVLIAGWSLANVSCTGAGCSLDVRVRFDLGYRHFTAGDILDSVGWSGTSNHGTATFTSETCGAGSCFRADKLKQVTVDAAYAANNWSPGELVFLRIRRNNTFSTSYVNLTEDFHVSRIRLSYPN